jgi:hypothetical protein
MGQYILSQMLKGGVGNKTNTTLLDSHVFVLLGNFIS